MEAFIIEELKKQELRKSDCRPRLYIYQDGVNTGLYDKDNHDLTEDNDNRGIIHIPLCEEE